MNYKISMSDQGNYIIVKLLNDITIDIVKDFTNDIRKYSEQHNIKQFLFDMRNTKNIASTTENYNFAYKHLNELKMRQIERSAILVSPHDTSHNFMETALINAGVNIKMFIDKNKAIDWINGKKDY